MSRWFRQERVHGWRRPNEEELLLLLEAKPITVRSFLRKLRERRDFDFQMTSTTRPSRQRNAALLHPPFLPVVRRARRLVSILVPFAIEALRAIESNNTKTPAERRTRREERSIRRNNGFKARKRRRSSARARRAKHRVTPSEAEQEQDRRSRTGDKNTKISSKRFGTLNKRLNTRSRAVDWPIFLLRPRQSIRITFNVLTAAETTLRTSPNGTFPSA